MRDRASRGVGLVRFIKVVNNHMNDTHKEEIGAMIAKIQFVEWDRYVNPVEGEYFFYGWIKREAEVETMKQRTHDLVVVSYYQGNWWYITSSAKYTHELARIIDGTEEDHCPCIRVESTFDIPNMVRATN